MRRCVRSAVRLSSGGLPIVGAKFGEWVAAGRCRSRGRFVSRVVEDLLLRSRLSEFVEDVGELLGVTDHGEVSTVEVDDLVGGHVGDETVLFVGGDDEIL